MSSHQNVGSVSSKNQPPAESQKQKKKRNSKQTILSSLNPSTSGSDASTPSGANSNKADISPANPSSPINPNTPCRFYQLGQCNKGNSCPFLHKKAAHFSPQACKFFTNGFCRNGNSCPFNHDSKLNTELKDPVSSLSSEFTDDLVDPVPNNSSSFSAGSSEAYPGLILMHGTSPLHPNALDIDDGFGSFNAESGNGFTLAGYSNLNSNSVSQPSSLPYGTSYLLSQQNPNHLQSPRNDPNPIAMLGVYEGQSLPEDTSRLYSSPASYGTSNNASLSFPTQSSFQYVNEEHMMNSASHHSFFNSSDSLFVPSSRSHNASGASSASSTASLHQHIPNQIQPHFIGTNHNNSSINLSNSMMTMLNTGIGHISPSSSMLMGGGNHSQGTQSSGSNSTSRPILLKNYSLQSDSIERLHSSYSSSSFSSNSSFHSSTPSSVSSIGSGLLMADARQNRTNSSIQQHTSGGLASSFSSNSSNSSSPPIFLASLDPSVSHPKQEKRSAPAKSSTSVFALLPPVSTELDNPPYIDQKNEYSAISSDPGFNNLPSFGDHLSNFEPPRISSSSDVTESLLTSSGSLPPSPSAGTNSTIEYSFELKSATNSQLGTASGLFVSTSPIIGSAKISSGDHTPRNSSIPPITSSANSFSSTINSHPIVPFLRIGQHQQQQQEKPQHQPIVLQHQQIDTSLTNPYGTLPAGVNRGETGSAASTHESISSTGFEHYSPSSTGSSSSSSVRHVNSAASSNTASAVGGAKPAPFHRSRSSDTSLLMRWNVNTTSSSSSSSLSPKSGFGSPKYYREEIVGVTAFPAQNTLNSMNPIGTPMSSFDEENENQLSSMLAGTSIPSKSNTPHPFSRRHSSESIGMYSTYSVSEVSSIDEFMSSDDEDFEFVSDLLYHSGNPYLQAAQQPQLQKHQLHHSMDEHGFGSSTSSKFIEGLLTEEDEDVSVGELATEQTSSHSHRSSASSTLHLLGNLQPSSNTNSSFSDANSGGSNNNFNSQHNSKQTSSPSRSPRSVPYDNLPPPLISLSSSPRTSTVFVSDNNLGMSSHNNNPSSNLLIGTSMSNGPIHHANPGGGGGTNLRGSTPFPKLSKNRKSNFSKSSEDMSSMRREYHHSQNIFAPHKIGSFHQQQQQFNNSIVQNQNFHYPSSSDPVSLMTLASGKNTDSNTNHSYETEEDADHESRVMEAFGRGSITSSASRSSELSSSHFQSSNSSSMHGSLTTGSTTGSSSNASGSGFSLAHPNDPNSMPFLARTGKSKSVIQRAGGTHGNVLQPSPESFNSILSPSSSLAVLNDPTGTLLSQASRLRNSSISSVPYQPSTSTSSNSSSVGGSAGSSMISGSSSTIPSAGIIGTTGGGSSSVVVGSPGIVGVAPPSSIPPRLKFVGKSRSELSPAHQQQPMGPSIQQMLQQQNIPTSISPSLQQQTVLPSNGQQPIAPTQSPPSSPSPSSHDPEYIKSSFAAWRKQQSQEQKQRQLLLQAQAAKGTEFQQQQIPTNPIAAYRLQRQIALANNINDSNPTNNNASASATPNSEQNQATKEARLDVPPGIPRSNSTNVSSLRPPGLDTPSSYAVIDGPHHLENVKLSSQTLAKSKRERRPSTATSPSPPSTANSSNNNNNSSSNSNGNHGNTASGQLQSSSTVSTAAGESSPSPPPLQSSTSHDLKKLEEGISGDAKQKTGKSSKALITSSAHSDHLSNNGQNNPSSIIDHEKFNNTDHPSSTQQQEGNQNSNPTRVESSATGSILTSSNQRKQQLCMFYIDGTCRYGDSCKFIHGNVCSLCNKPCLFPDDPTQNEKHSKTCRLKREIEESKDLVCAMCQVKVVETNRKFGLLPECNDVICVPCLKEYRTSTSKAECPVCHAQSHFLVPSHSFPMNPDRKKELTEAFKLKMSKISCKYFDNGNGTCKYGDSCHFYHSNASGGQQQAGESQIGDVEVYSDDSSSDELEKPSKSSPSAKKSSKSKHSSISTPSLTTKGGSAINKEGLSSASITSWSTTNPTGSDQTLTTKSISEKETPRSHSNSNNVGGNTGINQKNPGSAVDESSSSITSSSTLLTYNNSLGEEAAEITHCPVPSNDHSRGALKRAKSNLGSITSHSLPLSSAQVVDLAQVSLTTTQSVVTPKSEADGPKIFV